MATQDFIPEGQDAGAQTDLGYVDYIPAPTPVKHELIEDKPEPVREKKVINKKK